MEYPPRPIPDTVGHYGENGIAFEGICGRFYGFVEYEKELPAFDVTNFALVPGPSPSYYPIDEEAARRAHEMMSFRDYQKGSKTWQYRVRVDEASMIADRQKKRIDPMYHEKVDRLLASFSRRLAENLNAESRIGTMCPSVLISGGSNFPVRKKQRQNEASERNMKEYQEIMGLISRICSVGTGGISSDEPQAIEKLKRKLEKLEKHQELMKAANAAIRMKDRGNMGSEQPKEMLFWTKEEYLKFIDAMMDKPMLYYAFEILYWCGIREGELLALTPADFDFEKKTLRINKSYQRLQGKDVITTPKTKKSNRVIQMPDFLCDEMQDYFKQLYGLEPDSRIFPLTKHTLKRGMAFGCKASGVKIIRIHDLRHSHVSLLINMGYSAVAIGNRVGHESVEITYRYAHLFPTVQKEMADKLNVERSN